jgi:adenylate cyclase
LRYLFDNFVLDTDQRELRCDGDLISLQPQVFDLLEYLIRNRDRVLTKDDLFAAVWGGRIISESSLTTRINAARTAIGDSGSKQRLIKTLPRKGFRFIGVLREGTKSANETAGSGEPPRPTLSVLPFDDLSRDPKTESFCDGLVDQLITALSRFRWLKVASRRSSFALRGRPGDIRKVAEELGTRFVLEGSARRSVRRMHISAQLIDGKSGKHIWAERYDCDDPISGEAQDDITRDIVASLEYVLWLALSRTDAHLAPPDSTAFPLRAAAWHIAECTQIDNGVAVTCATRALSANPKSVAAYQYLANALISDLVLGWSADAESDIGRLVDVARRAVALAPEDHLSQGLFGCALSFAGDYDQAMNCIRRALELNRNSINVLGPCGNGLSFLGDAREANEMLGRMLRLAPGHYFRAGFLSQMAMNWLRLGEPERGLALAREATDLKSDAPFCQLAKASILTRLDRPETAQVAISEVHRLRPGLSRNQIKNFFPHKDRSLADMLADLLQIA